MKIYATFLLCVLCVLVNQAQNDATRDIVIHIENLPSNEGKIFAALYNDESSFLKKDYQGQIANITNNSCTVTFKSVPRGVYAVSFFQDENNNQKMDTNFMGIPKEPYGCSNNAKGFMGPPKWEDAKFEVKDQDISKTISL